MTSATATPASSAGGFVAPISSASPAFTRSQLTHGIRQVSHCILAKKSYEKKCSDRKMTTYFCKECLIIVTHLRDENVTHLLVYYLHISLRILRICEMFSRNFFHIFNKSDFRPEKSLKLGCNSIIS